MCSGTTAACPADQVVENGMLDFCFQELEEMVLNDPSCQGQNAEAEAWRAQTAFALLLIVSLSLLH